MKYSEIGSRGRFLRGAAGAGVVVCLDPDI